jgi:hypothetical protein
VATRRSLSASICTSESVESLSEWAQLLLDRLIITADDFGIHEASPVKLKAVAKPISARPPAEFAQAVAEMANVDIVGLYEAEGRAYLFFPKWDMHQSGLHKRTRSRFPDPKTGRELTPAEYIEIGSLPLTSRKFPEKPGNSGTVPLNERTNEQNEENLLSDVRRTTPSGRFAEESTEYRLSADLLRCIRERNPNHKQPNMQTWARQIDLMIRCDARDPEDIRRVIEWAQHDKFWQDNILSTTKLREQFDQLLLKSRRASIRGVGKERPEGLGGLAL